MSNQLIPTFKFKKFVPAAIEFNYDELDAALDKHLEKFENIIVTVDTLADSKKLAQDLNKQVKEINRARIDKKAELSEPIALFEQQMKALVEKINIVNDKIKEQLSVFEQERLDLALNLITDHAFELARNKNLEDKYFEAVDDDIKTLVKLTALTASGNLTGTAKNDIAVIVQHYLDVQSTTALRLAQLEATCYRNGLSAPLTADHVESFLYENEVEYSSSLENLIKVEVEREKQAQAAIKARIEAEARLEAERKVREEEAAKALVEREKMLAEQEAQRAKDEAARKELQERLNAERKERLAAEQRLAEEAAKRLEEQRKQEEAKQKEQTANVLSAVSEKVKIVCVFYVDNEMNYSDNELIVALREAFEEADVITPEEIYIEQ